MFHILLILGLTFDPNAVTVEGKCVGLEKRTVECKMQSHRYGRHYVTDGKVVYYFRQVWWGVYDMSIDGTPHKTAKCSFTEDNLVCTNTFTFISEP